MRHRTRMLAAAATAAAALAGSTAAATAPAASASVTPTASATPPPSVKQCVSVVPIKVAPARQVVKIGSAKNLAARLGVSPTRLEQVMRDAKTTMLKDDGKLSPNQFDATIAHLLGISPAQVQHALPNAPVKSIKITISMSSGVVKSASGKAPGPLGACVKLPSGKTLLSPQQVINTLAAKVASELNVSTAQVKSALAPMLATGRINSSSAAFATAARSLGVSVQQLLNALAQAKQSLAPAS